MSKSPQSLEEQYQKEIWARFGRLFEKYNAKFCSIKDSRTYMPINDFRDLITCIADMDLVYYSEIETLDQILQSARNNVLKSVIKNWRGKFLNETYNEIFNSVYTRKTKEHLSFSANFNNWDRISKDIKVSDWWNELKNKIENLTES